MITRCADADETADRGDQAGRGPIAAAGSMCDTSIAAFIATGILIIAIFAAVALMIVVVDRFTID